MKKDIQETINCTLENKPPEDNQTNDKQIRALIQEKIDTNDYKEFTLSEIKTAVASMKEKKAPGRTESQAKYTEV